MIDVAVIILTCNQKQVTLRFLESFENVDQDRVGILVWDNGSSDGTMAAIESQFPDVKVRRSDENLGAAGGRNAGAQAAMELWEPEYFLFLDNDTVVTSGFIQSLRGPLEKCSAIGMTTPKIRQLDNPEMIDAAGGCHVQFYRGQTPAVGHGELDRGQYDTSRDCVAGAGGFTLVRTDVFEEVEGFDEGFDPYGAEDIDFSLSVKKAGYRCVYVPEALVYHKGTQTFESGQYSAEYARKKAENWYRLVQKHANPLEKAAFWLVGVPVRLLGAFLREVRRGNIGAVTGLISGGLSAIFRTSDEKEDSSKPECS